MFAQIPPTEFDLRFQVLGIPVRVHPVFWLTSAFLAWDQHGNQLSVTLVRMLCIFVAIIVHELGHAVVTRHFGWRPEIVLYFLGGYATTARHSTWKDIAVSAAGPAAGFLLLLITVLTGIWAKVNGIEHRLVWEAIGFSFLINLMWNVLNLVPVMPLDGGHISRNFLEWLRPRDGLEWSLKVSVAASGGVALWAAYCMSQDTGLLGLDPMFLLIMFGFLCYQSFQQLQLAQRGYW